MPDIKQELKAEIVILNKAFEDFKKENDELLKTNDKLASEKVDKISDAMSKVEDKIDDMEKQIARGELPSEQEASQNEYKDKFFNSYIRKGVEDGLDKLAVQANLNIETDSDGGITILEETDRNILRLAEDKSPIRQFATVVTVGGSDYRRLVAQGNVGSGWVGETDARPETGTPTFVDIKPTMGEVYANPASTQKMLDDAFFSVEDFLTREGIDEFTRQENIAFVTGNGTDKPIGVLAGPMSTAVDGVRPFKTVQTYASGAAAGLLAGAAAYDKFMDFMDELKEDHEPNAIFMMHRKTKTAVRKIKDNDDNYMWRSSVEAGQPSTLFETRVATNSNFPQLAANAKAILYGDLKRAYKIIDRIGTRVLRDPYTNKPYVHFYMTKRVGSMLEDSEAIKVLTCTV